MHLKPRWCQVNELKVFEVTYHQQYLPFLLVKRLVKSFKLKSLCKVKVYYHLLDFN